MIKPQSTLRSLRFLILVFACVAFVAVQTSLAQDESTEETAEAEQEPEGFPYSPDFCEFTITFPDEPYSARRCEDEAKTRCYDLVSYTQVYEMSATVNFRVICNPVDESVYEDYSAEIMEATLRAMTKDTVISEYNSAFREEEDYKQAGLAGEGKVGRMPMIYIAQLWIGRERGGKRPTYDIWLPQMSSPA